MIKSERTSPGASRPVARPSLARALLVVLAVILQPVSCSVRLYVAPDLSSCPPTSTCKTLQQYAHNSSYFVPGTTFLFLPGTHHLSSPIHVAHLSGDAEEPLQLVATEGEATISCESPLSLSFTNYSSLTLSRLVISGCGTIDQPALLFHSVTSLQLIRLSVLNSSTADILAIDVGNMTITEGNFNFTGETVSSQESECTGGMAGTLCRSCGEGLSLTLGPPTCQSCSNKHLFLLPLFALSGLLLVVFIKILDLTVTRGTINGLLFYANIVWINRYLFFDSRETSFSFVFLAWLNLDVGVVTCFYDELDMYALTWLQYVFPLYVCLLGLLLVTLPRCFPRLAKVLGGNSLSVLATIFLLVYTKILRNIVNSLSPASVKVHQTSRLVWALDGSYEYLGSRHVYLFAVAVLLLVLLWLPYTLLLLLGHRLMRLTQSRLARSLLDSYHTPLQTGKRFWVGLLLVVRCALLLVSALAPPEKEILNLLLTLLLSLLLLYLLTRWGSVYRNKRVGQLETSFLFNLAVLAAVEMYTQSVGTKKRLATVQTSVFIVFIKFLLILAYHVYCLTHHLAIVKQVEAKVKQCLPRGMVERRSTLPVGTISLSDSLTIQSMHSDERGPSPDFSSPPPTTRSWSGGLRSVVSGVLLRGLPSRQRSQSSRASQHIHSNTSLINRGSAQEMDMSQLEQPLLEN